MINYGYYSTQSRYLTVADNKKIWNLIKWALKHEK